MRNLRKNGKFTWIFLEKAKKLPPFTLFSWFSWHFLCFISFSTPKKMIWKRVGCPSQKRHSFQHVIWYSRYRWIFSGNSFRCIFSVKFITTVPVCIYSEKVIITVGILSVNSLSKSALSPLKFIEMHFLFKNLRGCIYSVKFIKLNVLNNSRQDTSFVCKIR